MKNLKVLSAEEIDHLAWLARIELSEQEKRLFTQQLNTIIEYFHVIDEAETRDVVPTLHVLDLVNVFREDIVEGSISSEQALANARRKEKGYFKAPSIV